MNVLFKIFVSVSLFTIAMPRKHHYRFLGVVPAFETTPKPAPNPWESSSSSIEEPSSAENPTTAPPAEESGSNAPNPWDSSSDGSSSYFGGKHVNVITSSGEIPLSSRFFGESSSPNSAPAAPKPDSVSSAPDPWATDSDSDDSGFAGPHQQVFLVSSTGNKALSSGILGSFF